MTIAQNHPRDRLALDAFLNSAFREARLEAARFEGESLVFRDPHGHDVRVPVRARSRFRCLFDGPIHRCEDGVDRMVPIAALLGELSVPGGAVFRDRVLDSLAAIRRAPAAPTHADVWSFIEAEQALKTGHPLHPNPRSRDGMTAGDAARYAPEQEGRFALVWLRADRSIVGTAGGSASRLAELAASEGIAPAEGGDVRLPWHPWQAERLLAREDVRDHVAAGRLEVLGPGRDGWAATSSMRTVHAWHAPFMLKVSLSLRLTNSVRVLDTRDVARGLQISELLGTALGAELRAAFPTLRILAEPGFVALRDATGRLIEETLVVLRENPFRDPGRPGPVMLASLCEPPVDGPSPLGALIGRLAAGGEAASTARAWFERFLDVAILPLLEIRARYGLLFGAHQQNIMIGLRDGWPCAVRIRDCQGTGHLAGFHDRLTAFLPGLGDGAENVVDAALGDGLMTYYVVVNGVFNTIATLVLDGLVAEHALLETWRRFLERARAATPGETALYDLLLEAPALDCKGNFATSLSGVNEADGDARGQLASFLALPNPLTEMERT